MYILELATILATRDAETVKQLGKDVADALQGVVRHAKELHPVIVSRTMYYLLNLLMASNVGYPSGSLKVERSRLRVTGL